MTAEPILTTLDIGIGQLFSYKDNVWVRVDRYSATRLINQGAGAAMFGFMGQGDGEYDEEWSNVLHSAVKLDNELAEKAILNSLVDSPKYKDFTVGHTVDTLLKFDQNKPLTVLGENYQEKTDYEYSVVGVIDNDDEVVIETYYKNGE